MSELNKIVEEDSPDALACLARFIMLLSSTALSKNGRGLKLSRECNEECCNSAPNTGEVK